MHRRCRSGHDKPRTRTTLDRDCSSLCSMATQIATHYPTWSLPQLRVLKAADGSKAKVAVEDASASESRKHSSRGKDTSGALLAERHAESLGHTSSQSYSEISLSIDPFGSRCHRNRRLSTAVLQSFEKFNETLTGTIRHHDDSKAVGPFTAFATNLPFYDSFIELSRRRLLLSVYQALNQIRCFSGRIYQALTDALTLFKGLPRDIELINHGVSDQHRQILDSSKSLHKAVHRLETGERPLTLTYRHAVDKYWNSLMAFVAGQLSLCVDLDSEIQPPGSTLLNGPLDRYLIVHRISQKYQGSLLEFGTSYRIGAQHSWVSDAREIEPPRYSKVDEGEANEKVQGSSTREAHRRLPKVPYSQPSPSTAASSGPADRRVKNSQQMCESGPKLFSSSRSPVGSRQVSAMADAIPQINGESTVLQQNGQEHSRPGFADNAPPKGRNVVKGIEDNLQPAQTRRNSQKGHLNVPRIVSLSRLMEAFETAADIVKVRETCVTHEATANYNPSRTIGAQASPTRVPQPRRLTFFGFKSPVKLDSESVINGLRATEQWGIGAAPQQHFFDILGLSFAQKESPIYMSEERHEGADTNFRRVDIRSGRQAAKRAFLQSSSLSASFAASASGSGVEVAAFHTWAPTMAHQADRTDVVDGTLGASGSPLGYRIPSVKMRESMLASRTSRSAYWQYTFYQGPKGEKVRVHYCKSLETTERIAKLFLNEQVLGFDIEWKPSASVKDGIRKNVALVQLASEERVALFHIARFSKDDDIESLVAPTFKQIMESDSIKKVGVSVKGDCSRLRKYMNVDSRGLFELSHLYKLVKFSASDVKKINKVLVALAKQVEEHLMLPMYKDESVRGSDWSEELNYNQIYCNVSLLLVIKQD